LRESLAEDSQDFNDYLNLLARKFARNGEYRFAVGLKGPAGRGIELIA
jgi:hypothetical protein